VTLLLVFTGLLVCTQIFTIGVLAFDGWRVQKNGRESPPASAMLRENADSDGMNTATGPDSLSRAIEQHSQVVAQH